MTALLILNAVLLGYGAFNAWDGVTDPNEERGQQRFNTGFTFMVGATLNLVGLLTILLTN